MSRFSITIKTRKNTSKQSINYLKNMHQNTYININT